MATLKACVQKMRNDGFFPVYIRVTHNRTTQYIKTDKMVTKRQLLETPREFAPRGQSDDGPCGQISLALCGKIELAPENDCFSGAFL